MVTPVVVPVATVVAVNVAALVPSATPTEAGTVTKDGELSERATVKDPDVTLELSVTVQVLDRPPIIVEGAQETPFNTGVG
jgi:hypothetical protein